MAESRIVRTLRRQLKDAFANRQHQVREIEVSRDGFRDAAQAAREALARAQEQEKSNSLGYEAHIAVLQGDRDALTRTIEVLSRRLASPQADRDPVRAGWRAQQAMQSPLNEKATDPRR